ncbi:MAG: DUF2961 domain-containing protein [Oscillospiraceae bacterium]|nr:DUF2961 domain-containing protein [Oscillospiraceae bacterium]
MEPFRLPLTPEQQQAFLAINKKFENHLADAKKPTVGEISEEKTLTVPAGGSVNLLDRADSGAITGIRIKINGLKDPGDDWDALAELTVSAYWDGETDPSVWATLGGFFGSVTGLCESESLPVGVTENGVLYSNWYMPFETGAKLKLQNDASKPYSITYQLFTAPLVPQTAAGLLRFHAKWIRLQDPPKNDRWPDSLLLRTRGKGRFLGTSMHIYKEIGTGDPEYHPDWWWGEGDEKFFIDGEKFPSWFGTGSEDYFGYAWGSWNPFAKPYHSQPFTNGGMWGIGSRMNNRFHITDSIPFGEKFEGYIEKYHRDKYSNQVCVIFWYLEKNGLDTYRRVSLEERTKYYRKPYSDPSLYYDAEKIIIINSSGMTKAETQDMTSFNGNWTNHTQLMFSADRPNAVMNLRINIPESGKYSVCAAFTKAPDYGIAQHYIDDVPLGRSLDLYNHSVSHSGETVLQEIELGAGYHKLSVEMTGKNLSSTGYFYGMDYLKLNKN